jgi:hypothetical protein
MKCYLTTLAGALAYVLTMADGSANNLLIPGQTERLTISGAKIINQIPAARQRQWPKELPIFKRKQSEFSVAGLQALIDQSCFAGTNISALLTPAFQQEGNRRVLNFRTPDGLDYVFVDVRQGRVLLYCGTVRGTKIPPPDAVPALETVRNSAVVLAEILGVPAEELERKEDGSLRMTVIETDQFQRGIKYKESRAVNLSRSIFGYPILSQDDDKIQLQVGVNGHLLKFDMKWTFIEPARTNKLFRLSRVINVIKQADVVADIMNEYPADGIARIQIKDFRVVYVVPDLPSSTASSISEIWPGVVFHVIFESKTGEKTEGGLYAPILDSR